MMTNPSATGNVDDSSERMAALRRQLDEILAGGLPADPIAHAECVALIAGVLSEAFEAVGLRCTVVGGSAIEIHAPGVYKSGDIDLVIEAVGGIGGDPRVREVFTQLGFEARGRIWIRDDLVVDTPGSHLSDPDELVTVGAATFRVVKKEVLLRDRIVGFKYWAVPSYGQQAIYMLRVFGDDLDLRWLQPALESEQALDAFAVLQGLATGSEAISEEALQELLDRLRGRVG